MNRLEGNIIYDKSFDFALDTIELYRYLTLYKKEYVLSKQLLRSGTSIGANVSEAIYAQSKKDFLSKMYIAFKEASESRYWINLLVSGGFVDDNKTCKLLLHLNEIMKILNAITNTSKENLAK